MESLGEEHGRGETLVFFTGSLIELCNHILFLKQMFYNLYFKNYGSSSVLFLLK